MKIHMYQENVNFISIFFVEVEEEIRENLNEAKIRWN